MENSGVVTEVSDGKVKIRIERESACGGNCKQCAGCDRLVMIEAEDVDNFCVGDAVNIKMDNRMFLRDAFVGYGVPSIFFVAGAAAGYGLSGSELISFASGAGALLATLLAGRFFNRRSSKKYLLEKI